MTDTKNDPWLVDVSGNRARVAAADVDRWTPLGWTTTDTDPAPNDLVWLQHEEHGGRQLFAYAVAPTWAALGWHPSGPPEPVDLTKDQQLVDVQVTPTAPDVTKKAVGTKKEQ